MSDTQARDKRKKRKPFIAITIAALLIVAGIVLIVSALSDKWEVEREQARLREAYTAQLTAPQNEPTDDDAQDELPAVLPGDFPEEGEDASDAVRPAQLRPVCLLSIPRIKLNVVVAEGIENSVLRYAVGHFKGTAQPGEAGNFCVAGHRNYRFGSFFNRLNEMEVGDKLIVERGEQTYTYTVSEILVVEPEETWVLHQSVDAQITLVTCTPLRVGTQRLIVKGVLEQ